MEKNIKNIIENKGKGVTELVFILDRSGSMRGHEKDTIGGFNAMIEKQKKREGECYVSTVLFDNVSEVIHDRVKHMIERQKEKFGWEFLFIGANIDAVETAAQYGIGSDRAVNYNADEKGTKILYATVSESICKMRTHAPLQADWSTEINNDYRKRGSEK